MATIAEKLKVIEDNITATCERVGRKRKDIKIVVVSKTATSQQICEAISLNYCDFGESRLTHLKQVSQDIAKYLLETNSEQAKPSLPQRVNWHMIGHLQRNKIRQTLPLVSSIHSLDTLRLAEDLNTAAGKLQMKLKVYLQVNCSGEPQKYGVPVGAAVHLAEQICSMPNLRLIGMMTMAPLTDDQDHIRSAFRRAKEIFDDIADEEFIDDSFKKLSMGMSNDYEIAIEEGSTHLRIGSAIFSDR